MKAIRFHQYGNAGVLRYDEIEVPQPDRGQVRVRVAGTSFNGVENNIRAGRMQGPMPLTLPHTPGLDVAGTVDALGDGVDGLAVGDAVVGFLPFADNGAAAEFVLVAAETLAPAPVSIPLADAAALPLVGLTAFQALFEHAQLQAGQRILITGAGGAVGGYAVQLATAAGAYVIALTSPRTRAVLAAQGAQQLIDYTGTDLLAEVTGNITEPIDALLNLAPIAMDQFAGLTALVRDGGVVVSTTVWMPAPSDEARGVRGIDLFVRSDAAQLADLAGRVDRGELTVTVTEHVALADLKAVHARAEAGTLTGKVVILPPTT